MVHLIGVCHSAHQASFFGSEIIQTYPSNEFLDYLSKFPKDTKIGLEFFTEENWKEVKQNLNKLNRELIYDGNYHASYGYECGGYWDKISKFCNNIRLETTFLENKEIWLKINKSSVNVNRLKI